jgi:ATP-dependent RNA helicase DeaD
MDQFVKHINILVATDLAARGIDVKEISYVVITIYRMRMNLTHRSGRTARAGAREFLNGTARRRGARNCRL